jgi:hypothetical protein
MTMDADRVGHRRNPPRDEAVNFLEHCILVASGSDQANDGEYIERALGAVAGAFWPDLAPGAAISFNVETDELTVETPNALYYISVCAVSR